MPHQYHMSNHTELDLYEVIAVILDVKWQEKSKLVKQCPQKITSFFCDMGSIDIYLAMSPILTRGHISRQPAPNRDLAVLSSDSYLLEGR